MKTNEIILKKEDITSISIYLNETSFIEGANWKGCIKFERKVGADNSRFEYQKYFNGESMREVQAQVNDYLKVLDYEY